MTDPFSQSRAARLLLRWTFARCALCAAAAADALCADCAADLPRLDPARLCPRCAAAGGDGQLCGRCIKNPPAFDATAAVFHYAHPVDRLIGKFKYADNGWPLAAALARLCAPTFAVESAAADLLVPVPLHPRRERRRGFNQALEAAKPLARILSLPLAPDALRRIKASPPQTEIKEEARRRANARNAYQAVGRLDGKTVALFDDVMTSGATLHNAARALKRAGAKTVVNWTIARAERR